MNNSPFVNRPSHMDEVHKAEPAVKGTQPTTEGVVLEKDTRTSMERLRAYNQKFPPGDVKYNDDTMPVSAIARCCHEVNRNMKMMLGEETGDHWESLTVEQRLMVIKTVTFVLDNPIANAQVVHLNWLHNMEKDGWRYGEVKDEEAKTHPLMVQWEDLPNGQKAKDVVMFTVIRSFMPLGFVE